MTGGNGRYAPSPSSDLHLGNLRTAVVAYVAARATGRGFVLRVEDIDQRSRPDIAQRQLADLAALGLVWDAPPLYQTDRSALYCQVVADLAAKGLVYECFCSRREILEAPRAPHQPPGAYPGTCRDLSDAERKARRKTRPGAWRLRSDLGQVTLFDQLYGSYAAKVDDFVLMRADSVAAYNLAVVVDDAAQSVSQVVRGQDLLASTPRQAYLAQVLGLGQPSYLHVPLVLARDGSRLSKRDAAMAGAALWQSWGGPGGLVSGIGQSLGLLEVGEAGDIDTLVARFDLAKLPRQAWTP